MRGEAAALPFPTAAEGRGVWGGRAPSRKHLITADYLTISLFCVDRFCYRHFLGPVVFCWKAKIEKRAVSRGSMSGPPWPHPKSIQQVNSMQLHVNDMVFVDDTAAELIMCALEGNRFYGVVVLLEKERQLTKHAAIWKKQNPNLKIVQAETIMQAFGTS